MRLLIVAALAAAVPAASPPLAAYVGKYPFDKVQGLAFLDHPGVRRAVSNALFKDSVQRTVLEGGTSGPIELQGSLIVSTACEPHNCAWHQWTIAILQPNGSAAVCYHDQDLMGQEGRWFVGGRPVYRTTSGCWSGNYTPVPDGVIAALVKQSRQ